MNKEYKFIKSQLINNLDELNFSPFEKVICLMNYFISCSTNWAKESELDKILCDLLNTMGIKAKYISTNDNNNYQDYNIKKVVRAYIVDNKYDINGNYNFGVARAIATCMDANWTVESAGISDELARKCFCKALYSVKTKSALQYEFPNFLKKSPRNKSIYCYATQSQYISENKLTEWALYFSDKNDLNENHFFPNILTRYKLLFIVDPQMTYKEIDEKSEPLLNELNSNIKDNQDLRKAR